MTLFFKDMTNPQNILGKGQSNFPWWKCGFKGFSTNSVEETIEYIQTTLNGFNNVEFTLYDNKFIYTILMCEYTPADPNIPKSPFYLWDNKNKIILGHFNDLRECLLNLPINWNEKDMMQNYIEEVTESFKQKDSVEFKVY